MKGLRAPSAPELPFSVWQEKRGPLRRRSGANGEAGPKGGGQDDRSKERPPRLKLATHPWGGKSVKQGVAPPHRRTRNPGRAARHLGAHSVRHCCAVAKPKSREQRIPPCAEFLYAANVSVRPQADLRPSFQPGHHPGSWTPPGVIADRSGGSRAIKVITAAMAMRAVMNMLFAAQPNHSTAAVPNIVPRVPPTK